MAQASESIVDALPSVPPTTAEPYNGASSTAATRASLQYALDHYTPGSISHQFQPSESDLSRSDSRSFGVTHAAELSGIGASSSRPGTPPSVMRHESHDSASQIRPSSSPIMPVNPAALNNEPAKIPSSPQRNSGTGSGLLKLQPEEAHDAQEGIAPVEGPTVAETGVPLSAGANGPGPSSGSIHDIEARRNSKLSPMNSTHALPSSFPVPEKNTSNSNLLTSPIANVSPSQASLSKTPIATPSEATGGAGPAGTPPAHADSTGPAAAKFESAEDEKARLQREERERILRGGASTASATSSSQP